MGEDFEDAIDQGVDVGGVVVEGQGGAHGALDVVVMHDGLGAVVPGTDGDPLLIFGPLSVTTTSYRASSSACALKMVMEVPVASNYEVNAMDLGDEIPLDVDVKKLVEKLEKYMVSKSGYFLPSAIIKGKKGGYFFSISY